MAQQHLPEEATNPFSTHNRDIFPGSRAFFPVVDSCRTQGASEKGPPPRVSLSLRELEREMLR